jgi:hypothetical protein
MSYCKRNIDDESVTSVNASFSCQCHSPFAYTFVSYTPLLILYIILALTGVGLYCIMVKFCVIRLI